MATLAGMVVVALLALLQLLARAPTGASAVSVQTRTYVGGLFQHAGGNNAVGLAQWDEANGAWTTLAGSVSTGSRIAAMVMYRGELVVGGKFTSIGGYSAPNIARYSFSDQAWRAVSYGTSAGSSDVVLALAVVNDVLYVGGHFSGFGNTNLANIGRWPGVGVNTASLGSGLSSGNVNAICAFRNEIYAGGTFSGSQSVTVTRIARWSESTGLAWAPLQGASGPNGVDGDVWGLQAFHDILYIAGGFSNAGATASKGLVGWTGTAWVALTGLGGPLPYAHAFVVRPSSDTLLVLGEFSSAGSGGDSTTQGIAAYAPGTAAWSAVASNSLGGAVLVASADGSVVGGRFTGSFNRVARLDASGAWTALGAGVDDEVQAVLTTCAAGYYGAGCTAACPTCPSNSACNDGVNGDGTCVCNAAYCGSDCLPCSIFAGGGPLAAQYTIASDYWFNYHVNIATDTSDGDSVRAFALYGTDLIIGGHITYATPSGSSTPVFANLVKRSLLHNADSACENVGGGVDGDVYALLSIAAPDALLVVAGAFLNCNVMTSDEGNSTGAALPARYVALWNGTDWTAMTSDDASLNQPVTALAFYGGQIVAAGTFTQTVDGSVALAGIATYAGSAASAWVPLGTGLAGTVRALTVFDGKLVAAGLLTAAGGVAVANVARWDGSAWSAIGAGTNGQVNALAVLGSLLIAGGQFTAADGNYARNIAQWDGTRWTSLGPVMGVDATIYALLAIDDGRDLVAAGAFGTAGAVGASKVALWHRDHWVALGGGPGVTVAALAEVCLPNEKRFGENCTSCQCSWSTTIGCDDGPFGTGACTCTDHAIGALCDACEDGYYGTYCSQCPACGAHGSCNQGYSGDGSCTCSEGWTGALCDQCATFYCGADCTRCPAVVGGLYGVALWDAPTGVWAPPNGAAPNTLSTTTTACSPSAATLRRSERPPRPASPSGTARRLKRSALA